MRLQKVYCDICGCEIPAVKKTDIFGIERTVYKTGIIKICDAVADIDSQALWFDWCERCVDDINASFVFMRALAKK